jgi:hypothetical protein
MRWIRDNLRVGVWCALFALAVQFTVSFGHVHVSDLARGSGSLAVFAADQSSPPAPSDLPVPPGKPAGALDYCAICAVINLAGSVVPASAPVLPVAVAFHPVQFWSDGDAVLAASPHRLFKARAPPVA